MRSCLTLSLGLLAGCAVDGSAGKVERCALGARIDPLAPAESEIGRRFDLDRTYHQWDDTFPNDYERQSAAQGRTIVTSVNGNLNAGGMVPFARVADPNDAAIQGQLMAMAGRVRDFGHPIFVIYHDEADNDGAFGTPTEFIAAWQRVVTVFHDAGADNVMFVWSLSSKAFPSAAEAWYPGDAWVDWIGATGFNWYTGDPVSPWRTFVSIFAPFFEWSAAHPQPLIIPSTSCGENPNVADDAPKSKPTWIREALATLHTTPNVQAMVWFGNGSTTDPHKDWNVDSSPATLAAFRELADDPHFDVTARTPP